MTGRMTRRRLGQLISALALAPAAPHVARAQDAYPSRALRIVVPTVPGGALDTTTRLVAQRMGDYLRQPVIIDNRPGADTVIGTRLVRDAPADGYTLLGQSGGLTARPAFYHDVGYDLNDFAAVGPMIRAPFAMLVGAGQPDRSVADFVARARANATRMSVASAGTATPPHVAALKFLRAARLELLHVPYRGNGAAMPDVLGGRVDALFEVPGISAGHIAAGRARTLAVTSSTRLAILPGVPTFEEEGYPSATYYFWLGLLAPARTPRPVLERLSQALRHALTSRELSERFASEGSEVMLHSAAEFEELMRQEVVQMAAVASDLGIAKE